MPKNKGKGGKSRRRGKGDNGDDKRELIFKEDGQEYAQVLTMLGNGRLEVIYIHTHFEIYSPHVPISRQKSTATA